MSGKDHLFHLSGEENLSLKCDENSYCLQFFRLIDKDKSREKNGVRVVEAKCD